MSNTDNTKTPRQEAIDAANDFSAVSKPGGVGREIEIFLVAMLVGPILHHLIATPLNLIALLSSESSVYDVEKNPVFFFIWQALWLAGLGLGFVNFAVLPRLPAITALATGLAAWAALGLLLGLFFRYLQGLEAE